MTGLQNAVMQKLGAEGWRVRATGAALTAEREEILSKWLLGKRSVKLKLDIIFDETSRTLTFRETAIEQSSGMPPPVFSMSVTTQKGAKVNERRTDTGIGGGTINYGSARQWVEQQCRNEGWTFRLSV